jgi:DNA-binding CsgD family transcriptional regulator
LTRADPFDVWTIGVAALYAGAHERSEDLLERAAGLARARGEFGVLAETLTMRAFQLALAQSFDGAAIAAEESSHFARELRAANLAVRCLSVLAYIAAIRGDEEAARRHARDVIEHAAGHGPSLGLAFALYALATVEMGQAHWPEALQHLEMLAETRRPGTLFVAGVSQPDLIEAAVHAGRTDIARSVLAELEVWAARPQAAWIRPRLASSRALLSDGAEASEHFEQALQLAAVARPFDLARIQLLYGEHLRRQRRRIDARVHLRAALEAFERFRAEPWAERARTELRASGEVARKRDPSTISQLTAQEIQVARLVAEGLSNKEAAAQLFLSPRTIDAHLRNVFAKLGLTSRTQLARVQLGGDEAPSVLGPALSPA